MNNTLPPLSQADAFEDDPFNEAPNPGGANSISDGTLFKGGVRPPEAGNIDEDTAKLTQDIDNGEADARSVAEEAEQILKSRGEDVEPVFDFDFGSGSEAENNASDTQPSSPGAPEIDAAIKEIDESIANWAGQAALQGVNDAEPLVLV